MRRTESREKAIRITDTALTVAVYIAYPLLLIWLIIRGTGFWPALFVPGISFVLVSIFRNIFNAPRPYETPGAPEPIIKRKGSGKSFPSRHVFSIFVIAATTFCFIPPAGIIMGLAGILLAATRALGGVHYARDVVAGAVIGTACGLVTLFFI